MIMMIYFLPEAS